MNNENMNKVQENSEIPAKNIALPENDDMASCGNAPLSGVPVEDSTDSQSHLTPACPNPTKAFEPLKESAVEEITDHVEIWLKTLCHDRGGEVDFKYWKKITRKLLGVDSATNANIIPAKAGSGKSTWISAFLLALCDMILHDNPLGTSLGGVLLVLQKVETLNEVSDLIREYFPGRENELYAALQGWNQSGYQRGFCKNTEVESHKQCRKEKCPFAANCQILKFDVHAETAPIVGMTQARFNLLRRENGEFERYLLRKSDDITENGENNIIQRRFLIFDEKFDMFPIVTQDKSLLNAASSNIEECGKNQRTPDAYLRHLQADFKANIDAPFNLLRRITVLSNGKDKPFGLCSLRTEDIEVKDKFIQYHESFESKNKAFLTQDLQDALDVTQALYQQDCLFSKSGGFKILYAKQPTLQFGQAQTIIFDATAEVDGDYQQLQNVNWLSSSATQQKKSVQLHVYRHEAMNATRNAMKSDWKLPAFANLIDEIIEQYPHKTFLCTYKSMASELYELLSPNTQKLIALMPNSNQLPYFGGTNGANHFNDCTNVIIVGYPRLSPTDYLFHTYAAWKDDGFMNELDELSNAMESMEKIPKDILRQLPMLEEYENHHLAARLEQEIYRCAIRNYHCEEDINIFLFAPPEPVKNLLSERLDGMEITHNDLPDCVASFRDASRTYDGERTTRNQVMDFLKTWDGQPIKPSEIREQLHISESAWKEIRKDKRFRNFMAEQDVIQTGRGKNAVFKKSS